MFVQVALVAENTGHTIEEVERDISRPKYFTPFEAKEYGIIDRVLEADASPLEQMVKAARGRKYSWV